jgi:hypothetical protein
MSRTMFARFSASKLCMTISPQGRYPQSKNASLEPAEPAEEWELLFFTIGYRISLKIVARSVQPFLAGKLCATIKPPPCLPEVSIIYFSHPGVRRVFRKDIAYRGASYVANSSGILGHASVEPSYCYCSTNTQPADAKTC